MSKRSAQPLPSNHIHQRLHIQGIKGHEITRQIFATGKRWFSGQPNRIKLVVTTKSIVEGEPGQEWFRADLTRSEIPYKPAYITGHIEVTKMSPVNYERDGTWKCAKYFQGYDILPILEFFRTQNIISSVFWSPNKTSRS